MVHAVTPLVVPLGGDQPGSAAQVLRCLCKTQWGADSQARGWLQAEAHGFGLQLSPGLLDPVDGEPVRSRIHRLLSEPSFQVCSAAVLLR